MSALHRPGACDAPLAYRFRFWYLAAAGSWDVCANSHREACNARKLTLDVAQPWGLGRSASFQVHWQSMSS